MRAIANRRSLSEPSQITASAIRNHVPPPANWGVGRNCRDRVPPLTKMGAGPQGLSIKVYRRQPSEALASQGRLISAYSG